MKKERPKIGVGVVVIKDNKVLLGKRKGVYGCGTWAFPGGHLEFGETPEECASRELLEETGLQATQITSGGWTNNVFDENTHYVTLFMFVTAFTGVPQVLEPEKCECWEWFEWEHLPRPLFASIESLLQAMGIQQLKKLG